MKETFINLSGEDQSFVSSFGGESWDGDFEWSEYGIQLVSFKYFIKPTS